MEQPAQNPQGTPPDEERAMTRDKLLREIQAVGFALVELNLYLDTHPWDEQALAQFNHLSNHYRMLTYDYECHFGPLYNLGHSNSPHPWKWYEPPWPWQM